MYLKRHAGFADIATAALISSLIMWIRWQEFNPKVFVIFAAVSITTEVLIQLRYRLNLACQFCGFDPILYKRNPEIAAQVVKSHLDKIQKDPDFLLSERLQNTLKRLKRIKRPKSAPEAVPPA